MKIVLTGAGGGLGGAFLEVVPPHHEVVAFTHDDLDIGDHDAVLRTIGMIGPGLIVNAAGFTAVDANERDPARAFRVNAQGPQSLALAAREARSVLLHVSTDYVFDGRKDTPYDESDHPNPRSVYGRSKLLGERHVRDCLPDHLIVRTGFVFGGGTDHLSAQIARLRAGEDAVALADRVGSPTYVRHLAERLIPLALARRFGTYHLAGPEPTTWYDLVVRARQLGGWEGEVVPQRADDLHLPAPRPRQSALASVLMGTLSIPRMPPLDEALRDLLAR